MASGSHQVGTITAGEPHFIARAALYAAIVAVPWALRWQSVPNPDVSWLLIAARQWLNDGAVYGRDIIEINTPLALLLHVPPVWLAKATGLSIIRLADLWFLLVLLSGALAAGKVAGMTDGFASGSVPGLARSAMIVAIFAWYPIFEFGQRDVLASAWLLPYCLLRRGPETAASGRLNPRLIPTVMAGLACAVKPQFSAVIVVIFLLTAARHGLKNGILRSGLPLLAGMAVLYFALTVLFFSDWLAMFLQMGKVFAAWRDTRLHVFEVILLPTLLALACFALSFTRISSRALLRAASIPALVMAVELVLEGRAWVYRIMPITLFPMAGFALVLVSYMRSDDAKPLRRWIAPAFILAMAGYLMIATFLGSMRTAREQSENAELITAVRSLTERADSILFLSRLMTPVLFMVLEEERPYPFGYPSLWDFSAAIIGEKTGRLSPIEANTYAESSLRRAHADIVSLRPRLIAVEDRSDPNPLVNAISIPELLRDDKRFADALKSYALWGRAGGYEIFVRSAP